MAEIDTTNKFLVGSNGDGVTFLKPLPPRLSCQDALLLAAFLVALCDHGEGAEDDSLIYAKVQRAVNNA